MKICFVIVCLMCVIGGAVACDSGWYMENKTCVQCPQNYSNSVPNATSINDCYLISEPGKYVATAGAAMVLCATNHYCPGNVPVFYDLVTRYVNVDYIHGTGTQYIDTGIILGSDIDTKMVFETEQIPGIDAALFGATWNGVSYWLNGYNNNAYIRYNDYAPEGEYKAHILPNIKHILEITGGNWIFDNNSIYTNDGVFNVGLSGYLFASNRSTGVKWIHPALKVYSFTQWRGGKLVLDLVPVYDVKTGQYGMWDNVGGRFLGNIGTGEFLGGEHMTEFSRDGSVACAVATGGDASYSPVGSDNISDCGYVMHFGENRKLYLHSEKRTNPSLAVQIKNRVFYADTSSERHGFLRVEYNGQILSIIDD